MDASQARTTAREAKSEVEQLRFDVERLLIITEALWSIAKEKLECSDEDLIRRPAPPTRPARGTHFHVVRPSWLPSTKPSRMRDALFISNALQITLLAACCKS